MFSLSAPISAVWGRVDAVRPNQFVVVGYFILAMAFALWPDVAAMAWLRDNLGIRPFAVVLALGLCGLGMSRPPMMIASILYQAPLMLLGIASAADAGQRGEPYSAACVYAALAHLNIILVHKNVFGLKFLDVCAGTLVAIGLAALEHPARAGHIDPAAHIGVLLTGGVFVVMGGVLSIRRDVFVAASGVFLISLYTLYGVTSGFALNAQAYQHPIVYLALFLHTLYAANSVKVYVE